MQRAPLTEVEKSRIYQGKLDGKTLANVAAEVGCSEPCARKWWRCGRDHGWQGLRQARRGRGPSGTLSHFAPIVADKALAHKQEHQRWGAQRVLLQLQREPELDGLALPSNSRLAVYFKEKCPACVHTPRKRAQPVAPAVATEVHEVWQMDGQENVQLHDGDIATIASIRDPAGAAMVASVAYSTKTARRWRKLTIEELRHLFRVAFSEWGTLPDRVVTDNEAGQVGNTTDPLFPSLFTLWLVGLGIQHHPIRPHRPTDQAHVERNHRTLAAFTYAEADLRDLSSLQQALDRERHLYNHAFPARASQCQGRPPLEVYPALLQARRPYHPQLELTLFSLQRVLDYLAQISFKRKVSAKGQLRVGRARYSVGSRYAAQAVQVRLDPDAIHWVFYHAETGDEITRRPARGLDLHTLTGLDPEEMQRPDTPFQLAFAFFSIAQEVRLFQDC